MKRKDIKNLHQKNITELKTELGRKRAEVFKIRLEHKVKPNKNVRLAATLSDDIARIATVLNELKRKERQKT